MGSERGGTPRSAKALGFGPHAREPCRVKLHYTLCRLAGACARKTRVGEEGMRERESDNERNIYIEEEYNGEKAAMRKRALVFFG